MLIDHQILAIGFLLVILSAALHKNYLTLLVVATYVIAPLPNWICSRCANQEDFMENSGNAVIDFGRFCTGFLVVMGIGKDLEPRKSGRLVSYNFHADTYSPALPVLLAHCELIRLSAMAMSIVGGLLIYGTIISFTTFFQEQEDF